MPRPKAATYTDYAELKHATAIRCREVFLAFAGVPWSDWWHTLFAVSRRALKLEREALAFLATERRRLSTLRKLRKRARELPGHERLTATEVLARAVDRPRRALPRLALKVATLSSRIALIERVRRGPHSTWGVVLLDVPGRSTAGVADEVVRLDLQSLRPRFSTAPRRVLTAISLLCGNEPEFGHEHAKEGLSVSAYMKLETDAIRAAERKMEQARDAKGRDGGEPPVS